MNLFLTGTASSNVFNGAIELDSGGKNKVGICLTGSNILP